MTQAVLFLIILCLITNTISKTFSDCELVSQLRQQGFPEHQLRDWVCLIKAESSSRTHVVGGPNSDGSHDYGLFQINDRYWCNSGDHPGKSCNVRCQDLLWDDISKASQCAKKIFGVHGFSAWTGWVNKCQWNLPHINC